MQQVINNGASVNDPTAENLYTAFGKVNANDTELYGMFPVSVANGGTGTASALSGYVKGGNPFTASATVPYTDISGIPTGAIPFGTAGNASADLASSGAVLASGYMAPVQPAVPVVTTGGHGSALTDDELEELQRRRTALAIKARQDREKRERLGREIERQRYEAQLLAQEKERIENDQNERRRVLKTELRLASFGAALRSRKQAESVYAEQLNALRADAAAQQAEIKRREFIKKAQIKALIKEQKDIEEEEEKARLAQAKIEAEMRAVEAKRKDDADQAKAKAEADALMKRLKTRRRRETEMLMLDGML